ncbi:ExbD/TolR family protein [Roseovarius sp. E0-M6]|uniref:ExbD/TolR family protein n=1 Tax=Roseovarius sp. E0-M6 TaxID=3127118 RepID=UPI00300FF6C0
MRARPKPTREPTIALINIVFLMLVFFMVAGTLAQPLDKAVTLVRTADLEGRATPDALVVHADGQLWYRGQKIESISTFLTLLDAPARTSVRIVPDRDLAAHQLVSLAARLRAEGAERVLIVTERGI